MSAPEQTAEIVDIAEKAAGSDRWKELLHRTKHGQAMDIIHNAAVILRTDQRFKGRLRWSEMVDAVEAADLPWRKGTGWQEWSEFDDSCLADWCQSKGAYVKERTCAAAVQMVARDRTVHPVRNWLSSLKWDGTKRLDNWLSTYLGVKVERRKDETEEERKAALARELYHREVGRKWMISAVARIYRPGEKVDHALILESKQGERKSSTVEALVPDRSWFADEVANLGTKDSAQDLRGKWVIELGELSALQKSEVERVKAFMSRPIDHYRPSYGKRSQDFPRQCVFVGTTNEGQYLQDHTGNRRFWPVKVGRADLEALKRDREQLWAEAVAAFKAGERWWLDAVIEAVAANEQADRRIDDPWEDTIMQWARAQAGPVTVAGALECVEMPVERRDQKAQNRVSRIFTAYKWERYRYRGEGGLRWGYRPVPTLEPEEPIVPTPVSEVGTENPSDSSPVPTVPTVPSINLTHNAHAQKFTKQGGTTGNWEQPISWTDEQGWLDRLAKADAGECQAVALAWLKAAEGIVASKKPLTVRVSGLLKKCPALSSMYQNAHRSGIEVVT